MIHEAVVYIEDQVSKHDLLPALIKQVEKDFRMAVDPSIDIIATTPLELVEAVYEQLHTVVTKTSVSKFSSLLYRVDISEAAIKAIQSTDIEDYLKQVTFLLLKREYQKVYVRSTL